MASGTELPAKFVFECGYQYPHLSDRRGFQHCNICTRCVPVWFIEADSQGLGKCRSCTLQRAYNRAPSSRVRQSREAQIEAAARRFREQLATGLASDAADPDVPEAKPADFRRADILEVLNRHGGWMGTTRIAARGGYDERSTIETLRELADSGRVERVRGRRGWEWREVPS
jgi:hypothetical protein